MTFGESIATCFKKYGEIKGRASRSEYWWFILFIILGSIATSFVHNIASGLFTLAIVVPSIAVATRRLHDTDRSGWWQLLGFIPLIGTIILIVWYVQEARDPNRFGSSAEPAASV
jgi:uncharacterized membrane protein YhaH (DUF805 family)